MTFAFYTLPVVFCQHRSRLGEQDLLTLETGVALVAPVAALEVCPLLALVIADPPEAVPLP